MDGEIIAKLDLEITPQLQKEGIAREISRFLNQMRKEADYQVDDKVTLLYETSDSELDQIIKEFEEFLTNEALLSKIQKIETPEGDIVSLFTYEERNINFALKK
jgi:isoleucyl-tRNA synthetase